MTREMSDANVGAAMDTRVKVNLPEKLTDAGGRADSPEQSISTPSFETQSGFKRLRTTGWEEVEGSEQGEPGSIDEAPGTSRVVATQDEVRQLQERTKSACSQLAEVIIQLRREREWTEQKDANTAKKRELRLLLRSLERRLDKLVPTKQLDSLRKYIAFALDKAHPVAQLSDLLDDELQLILSRVHRTNGSPKQLLALSAVSKRFKKLIRQPAVWGELDLSSHASFLTDRLMLSIIRNDGAFSFLRCVSLSGCARVTDVAVCKLLSICGATLEVLDLQGCTLIKTSTVAHAAKACPNLIYLDLFGCTGVETLEALQLSDNHWPKLQHLYLMETSRLSGRVTQESFAELALAVEERRTRWQASVAAEQQLRRRREEEEEEERQTMMVVDHQGSAGAGARQGEAAAGAGWSATQQQQQQQQQGAAAAAAAAAGGQSAGAAAMSHDALCEESADCLCGPAVKLVDLPKFIGVCRRRLEAWADGHPVAACDHAMVMQGAMGEHGNNIATLNMLPNCGHVLCVECEQKSRVNMVRRHGDTEYVYPCPLCGNEMPNPGGFEITLQ